MRALSLLMIALLFASLQGDLVPSSEEPIEPTIITVDSTNLRFSPSSVTITEGDTVRFFWSGQALPHNAVEENEVFDSGEPARAVDYSFTFERGMNGTYAFVCEPHASVGMVGQITVEPAAEENTTTPEEPPVEAEDTPFVSVVAVFAAVGAAALVRRP